MKKNSRLTSLLAVLLIILCSGIPEQSAKYPVNYFRSPVGFPILLAGSFGEVRKNHFHSGIDIRTGGAVGKPVYAIADGYVARVFVSPGGFGKALYINHPNGFTSVYGHLQGFAGQTAVWVRAKQYKQEEFELDTPLEKNIIKVKKGDIVAWSGNSGASGGPHLHFEIRDSQTQETINPILFGMPVPDGISPSFAALRIYPHGENSLVNFSDKPVTLTPVFAGGTWSLKEKDTVKVTGNIVFGLKTFDYINGNGMKTGIVETDVWVDTAMIYSYRIDRFAFASTRFVNSMIDYPEVMKTNSEYLTTLVVPSNTLKIFGRISNDGMANFVDTKAHQVRILIKDAAGNSSQIKFWVKSHPPVPAGARNPFPHKGNFLNASVENTVSEEGMTLSLPANSLYEDLDFIYSASPRVPGTFSDVHHLHNENVPLHTFCDLTITPVGIPPAYSSKAVIVRVDDGKYSSKGGKYANGKITAQIREFGNYTVKIDTTPPVIRAVNISLGKKITSQKTIMIKMSDNLSGIRFYRGTINGKWILMDYDAKTASLTYVADDHLTVGKNRFKFVARDAVGNESVYEAEITR